MLGIPETGGVNRSRIAGRHRRSLTARSYSREIDNSADGTASSRVAGETGVILHECLKRVSRFLVRKTNLPRAKRRTDYSVRPAADVLETRWLLSGLASTSSSILASYNQNPLSFEPNVGQTASQVQFLSRGPGYSLYLAPDQAVLGLQQSSAQQPNGRTRRVTRSSSLDHAAGGRQCDGRRRRSQ